MRRVLKAVAAAAYVAFCAYIARSVFDARSVQWVMLIAFGVLCALPAFMVGRRAARTPRRVSSTPLDTRH